MRLQSQQISRDLVQQLGSKPIQVFLGFWRAAKRVHLSAGCGFKEGRTAVLCVIMSPLPAIRHRDFQQATFQLVFMRVPITSLSRQLLLILPGENYIVPLLICP